MLHVVVAANRPLTLAEMNIALAIRPNHCRTEEIDLKPEVSFQVTIRELCGLFVSIRDSKIYLIHQTAKEFLMGVGLEDLALGVGNPWKSSLSPYKSELVLAKASVFYLSLETFGIEALEVGQRETWETKSLPKFSTLVSKNPFLNYASHHVSFGSNLYCSIDHLPYCESV